MNCQGLRLELAAVGFPVGGSYITARSNSLKNKKRISHFAGKNETHQSIEMPKGEKNSAGVRSMEEP
jgi:hypothetical protein